MRFLNGSFLETVAATAFGTSTMATFFSFGGVITIPCFNDLGEQKVWRLGGVVIVFPFNSVAARDGGPEEVAVGIGREAVGNNDRGGAAVVSCCV